jgi:hypothetical protein
MWYAPSQLSRLSFGGHPETGKKEEAGQKE